MITFQNEKDLHSWLAERNIDTDQWGSAPTKSVTNLWEEIANGDALIQDDPPMRVVHVAEVVIRDGDKVLIEAEQEFGNEERRFRNRFPSEKMRIGEDVREAALRCLQEELGVSPENVTFADAPPEKIQEAHDSPSYPGLPSQYTFHRVEAKVAGLPAADFWRENAAFGHGDPVRRHRWAWREAE